MSSPQFADLNRPTSPDATPWDTIGSDVLAGRSRDFRVGLLVPMCGSAGIWGPCCIASAEAAAHELNQRSGIAGLNVRLILIDSAIESPVPVEALVDALIESRSIDAIVGMHISAVRQRLTKAVRGRIPYVYTPMYEGGEHGFGVFAIGDTPGHQLVPAMRWLQRRYRLRRWALIGNDYVWPRASHRYAKSTLVEMNASLVYEHYLPFSVPDLAEEVESIAKSGAEAVLISLIGQDAVDFNRIFGDMGLDRRIVRLSCVIEENGLLASGAENLERLFCSSSYFGAMATEANACFREVYHGFHGTGRRSWARSVSPPTKACTFSQASWGTAGKTGRSCARPAPAPSPTAAPARRPTSRIPTTESPRSSPARMAWCTGLSGNLNEIRKLRIRMD